MITWHGLLLAVSGFVDRFQSRFVPGLWVAGFHRLDVLQNNRLKCVINVEIISHTDKFEYNLILTCLIRVTLILHVIIHENIITLYSIRSGFSLVGWSPPYSFLNSFANSRYNIAWDLYRKASNKTSWTKIYCVCQKKKLLSITGMLHKQYFIRTRSQCPHANTARIFGLPQFAPCSFCILSFSGRSRTHSLVQFSAHCPAEHPPQETSPYVPRRHWGDKMMS